MISNQTMVYTNAIMGSVHYISPEQASGEKVTFLSDVYSLGVVLFEMLTGRVPFNGTTAVAVAMMHTEKDAPPLSEYMANVPKGLQDVLDKAMARHPEERFQSAAALRRALINVRMQLEPNGDYSLRETYTEHPSTGTMNLSTAPGNSTPWFSMPWSPMTFRT